MSVRYRMAIIVLLALGALTIVASLIRIVIILQLINNSSGFLDTDPDIIGSVYNYWTVLESGLAVILACLPTFPSIWNKSPDLLRRLRSMLSIKSLASSRSQAHQNPSDHHSTSSQAEIDKIGNLEVGMGNEAYVMKDLDRQEQHDTGSTV